MIDEAFCGNRGAYSGLDHAHNLHDPVPLADTGLDPVADAHLRRWLDGHAVHVHVAVLAGRGSGGSRLVKAY